MYAGLAGFFNAMLIGRAVPLASAGSEWTRFPIISLLTGNLAERMDRSALFLDRDGVINVDRGYIHRSDQFEFIPGIFELARFWTNELRRPIVVVANQSGIGRGYFSEYRRDHPWRKPKPGMILQAVLDLGLDPARCAILGDKISHMEAGAEAGIGLRVLIGPHDAKPNETIHEVVADLDEALALFRARFVRHVKALQHPT